MKINNIKIKILFFLGSSVLWSCSEEMAVNSRKNTPVRFLGLIEEGVSVSTRADVVINNLTYADYPTPIYIRMDIEGQENPQSGVYSVKSGYEGRLEAETGELAWFDLTSGHTFYGWTMPWKADDNINSDDLEVVHFDQKMYNSTTTPDLTDAEKTNCAILEKFIATKQGPVNYRENGEYVELQFRHLVSKVFIQSINLITNDGTTWQDVVGEMTIFGIPDRGYFNRHPWDNNAPYILHPENAGTQYKEYENKDVTYKVSKNAAFYLCPEIDFSELEFKIKLLSPAIHGETGEYYGDFKTVTITRRQDDNWDKDKKRNKLYANEVINLNLTLRQGNITGVTAFISDWTNKERYTSNNYPHPGIFTEDQLNDVFKGSKSQEEKEGMYSEGEDQDGKIFHLYNDLKLIDSSLKMPEGDVLDGMGHTITLSPDSSGNVYLQNIRDIYITDGTNTIYIDKEGNIYKVDSEGKRGEKIGTINKDSSTVNLSTGTVS